MYIISIEQKPVRLIQFRSHVVFLDLPMAYPKANLKSNGFKATPYFRPF
jgi:hypothetical protein